MIHTLIAALRTSPPQSFDELVRVLSVQFAAQVIIWHQTPQQTIEPLTLEPGAPQQPLLSAASDLPKVLDLAQLGPSTILPFNYATPHWISLTPALEGQDLTLLHGLLDGWMGRIAAEQAQQQARQSSNDHDETIALIAHDLKNPLTTIRGSAELLLRRATGEGRPERETRRLEIIIDQSDRMRDFLGTLVNMARLKSGVLALEKEQLDLSALVLSVVQPLNTALESARIVVSSAEPVFGLADRRWLKQALIHLFDNALKYSPPASLITISLAPEADGIVITVRDKGIGIEAAELGRIFQRFTRGKHSSRSATGSGLGLYTVQTVIQAHQGVIQVASAGLNQGSTFTLWLPAQASDGPAQHSQGGRDEQQT